MEKTTLHAPGISCGHCVMAIKRAVSQMQGVAGVEGNPSTKNVEVTYDPGKVSLAQIKQVMGDEGYPVAS